MFWDSITLSFAPVFGWPVVAFAGAVGLAILMAFVFARAKGVALRATTLALLLAALTNPSLKQEERTPLTDIAVAIVDNSQSQETGSRRAQTATALADLQKRVNELGNTELRVTTVTNAPSDLGEGTKLMAGLNEALSEIPPDRFAGAFFITDGQIHDIPEDLASMKSVGPIHGLISGSKSEIDRRVVIDQSPRFGIVGKPQTLQFHVEDQGSTAAEIEVTLRRDGGAVETIIVKPNQAVDIPFDVSHAGQNIIEIIASPLTGEITLQNNRAIAALEGIRDRLRVLLVSGEPHAGERTWRNLLKADASVDLVHFTILRPPEKQDGTPTKELALIAFPTRELFLDKIDEFDLVIFDRYRRQAILPDLYLANVADYVRRGGAALIASGPDFAAEDGLYTTPLADVLAAAPTGSVSEGAFKPQVTDQGKRHPVTRNLPGNGNGNPTWGRWFRLVDTESAKTEETLMAGTGGKPLLVLAHQGEGRVAQLLSDHGWLWARGYEGGGPQTELLRRIAHWLMKEPDLEEEALSTKQEGQFIVIERRTMAEKTADVTVTFPSGKTQSTPLSNTEPGLFTARLPITEMGMHTAADGVFTTATAIGSADAKETANISATDKIISPLTKITGGGVAWIEDGQPRLTKATPGKIMAGSNWFALRDNGLYRVVALREFSLFSTLLALAALLASAGLMWFREGL